MRYIRRMRFRHVKTGLAVRLTLLSILLAMQSLSFAHELDHFKDGDVQLCGVCSISSNLDAPIQASHEQPRAVPVSAHIAIPQDTFSLKVFWTPLSSRGPPSIS